MAAVEANLASQPTTFLGRLLDRIPRIRLPGTLLPQSSEGWARLGGMAVTPTVCAGLLVHTLVSHPTLTAGELLAYARFQADALGNRLADALYGTATGGMLMLEEAGVFRALSGSLPWLGLAVTAYGLVCLLSARTIYQWVRPSTGGGRSDR